MSYALARRVLVTLGVLFIYQVGMLIPLPGIEPEAGTALLLAHRGALGPFALPSTGIHKLAIFSLSITPYVSAAVVVQVLTLVSRRLRAFVARGERGRRAFVRLTLGLAALFAALQAYGVAVALNGVTDVVAYPASVFAASTVITLVGGVVLTVWLSDMITVHGVGNGIALVLLAGLVVQLPETSAYALQYVDAGLLSGDRLVGLVATAVVVIGGIAFMERARRRIAIDYPERQVGQHLLERRSSLLSLKLNVAGVIPVLFAQWVLVVAATLARLAAGTEPGRLSAIAKELAEGGPLYLIVFPVLIVLCTFFYSAFVFDPDAAAEELQAHGGSIAGVEPGEAIAQYLDRVATRTTLIGAVYLVLVFLIPELLVAYAKAPFGVGGTAFLLAVCAILDLDAQVRLQRGAERG